MQCWTILDAMQNRCSEIQFALQIPCYCKQESKHINQPWCNICTTSWRTCSAIISCLNVLQINALNAWETLAENLRVRLVEAYELLDRSVCLIRYQTVWLANQFMLLCSSLTIWWRPWDLHRPLSHVSDCSQKQWRAFQRKWSSMCVFVCVCVCDALVCFSEHSRSATENDLWHDPYNTAPKPTVQLLKIHPVCALTSATTSMNHAVHKYSSPQNNCSHFGQDVWHRVGTSATESAFAELPKTLLSSLKYLQVRLEM